MFLHIFRHIDTGHHVLVVKQIFSQSLCKFSLADTGRAKEYERADRTAWIVKTGAGPADGITDSLDCSVLTYHTFMKLFFKMKEFLLFTLSHFLNRNTGPAAYNLGDIFRIHLFLYHGAFTLKLFQFFLSGFIFVFLLLDLAITDLSHFCIIAFTFSHLSFVVELFDLYLVFLDLVNLSFLGNPFGFKRLFCIPQVCEILINFLDLIFVSLTFDCLSFDFELFDLARSLIKSLRHGVHFKTKF